MRIKVGKDGNVTIQDFSPLQAYKIAVKMEKDGIVFYQDLRKKIKDAETGREIDFLIEQEQIHLKVFEGLLDKEKEAKEDGFEEDDIVNYINSHIFDKSTETENSGRMEHRHTALEEAMSMERRSIIFYTGCLANTKDPGAKAKFENIIEEEKKHLSKFAELLRTKCINSQKGCLL